MSCQKNLNKTLPEITDRRFFGRVRQWPKLRLGCHSAKRQIDKCQLKILKLLSFKCR
jgi:hypothetical protein